MGNFRKEKLRESQEVCEFMARWIQVLLECDTH